MTSNRPKVLYFSHAGEDVYDLIRAAAGEEFDVVTLSADSDDERMRHIQRSDIVICAITPLRRKFIEHAETLKLVHHQGVGWQDTIDWQDLKERGIPLALTPEGTTIGVAEHAVLMMLAACKRLPYMDSELRAGRWHINSMRGVSRELFGKTIGYVGLGRIGKAVLERLVGFGCAGLYCDPAVTLPRSEEVRLGAVKVGLQELIERADVVTLHVPLTHDTRGMIGAAEIAAMKSGAILVNTARGGLVDEIALAAALGSGQLLAAALDVFETEPPTRHHPLLDLPNVVLTPHVSAGTRDAMGQKMTAVFENIRRYYRGEALRNRVDAW